MGPETSILAGSVKKAGGQGSTGSTSNLEGGSFSMRPLKRQNHAKEVGRKVIYEIGKTLEFPKRE